MRDEEEMIDIPTPKAIDRDDLDKNFLIYRMLLNYPERDAVPTKAIAEQIDVSPQKVAGLLGGAIRSPTMYNALVAAGYQDSQIPEWVVHGAGSEVIEIEGVPPSLGKMPVMLPESETPVEKPLIGIPAPEAPQGVETPSLSPSTRSELPGAASNLAQVYGQEDEVRRNLEKLNTVQTRDGRWVQAKPQADGSIQMVEVDVRSLIRARVLASDIAPLILFSNVVKIYVILNLFPREPWIFWPPRLVSSQAVKDSKSDLSVNSLFSVFE